MNNKIHTVIFDLDGTLSDSVVLTMEAFRNIAPLHGFPVPDEKSVRAAIGYANPEFYYRLFPDFLRRTVSEFGVQIENEESRVIKTVGNRLLFKGCRETLVCLKENGTRLCIASTGDERHVNDVLTETGILALFDSVSCGADDKTEMLKELSRNGEKTGYIMVGDMRKDYEAARDNGILSVGACYGYCVRGIGEFDVYIDEPEELLSILRVIERK